MPYRTLSVLWLHIVTCEACYRAQCEGILSDISLDRDANHPKGFRGFLSVFRQMPAYCLKPGQDHVLLNIFQCTIK